jgi:transcription factor IIIB subunit 2
VVIDDSNIVSEVTFGEKPSGAATVQGQFVGADQAHAGGGGIFPNQVDSRSHTILKTRERMEKLAGVLDIQPHIMEEAMGHFKVALAYSFVKGRKSQYVISACLYLACRRNTTNHMLMDFADALYVNVFAIGATYLQLIKALKISKIPLVDPSIFIQRFVNKLHFPEDGAKRVMHDAARLVQRMGKDWLHEGRRPAGIAAACVLLAARMNNFRRSRAEIVHVAKIAEETVQRRLDEFSSTSAGTLTVRDFRGTNIESAADPPSFVKHRELEKKLAELKEAEQEALARGENPPDPLMDPELVSIARQIDELDTSKKKELENEVKANLEDPKLRQAAHDSTTEREIGHAELDGDGRALSKSERFLNRYRMERELKRKRALESDPATSAATPEETTTLGQTGVPDEEDPENLEYLDDEELKSMILTDAESEIKSQVWMSLNRDYLIEQEQKRLKAEADQKSGSFKTHRKRRRQPQKPKTQDPTEIEDPAKQAYDMLQQKSSKKINYDAVNSLFQKKSSSSVQT